MRYVFCVGMYRACSTWQYEVISHLIEAKLQGRRLGFLDADDFARVRAETTAGSPVGVLKSHDAEDVYARSIRSGEAVTIYAYRDLRDVVYSFMHKASIGFDQIVGERFVSKVLRNDRFWRSQPGVFVQRYETLMDDQLTGIEQLAGRLGITLSEGEAARLAEEYSWQANFRRTLGVRRDAEASGIDLDDRANTNKQDPVTLLHWNHLRLRRSTSWRDLATVAERETLAFLCGDWLIDNGYEADRSWVDSPDPAPAAEPDGTQSQSVIEPQADPLPPTRAQLAKSWRLKQWLKMQGAPSQGGRKVVG